MDNGNSGLTAADVLALSNNNDNIGNNFWWVIIFFIIAGMFNGGGLFGGMNSGTANALNTDFVASQFSAQNNKFLLMDNQNAIIQNGRDMLMGNAAINQNIMQTGFETTKEVLENRYANALQTQELSAQSAQQALQAQSQLAQCCSDIKSTVHAENEATRNLITQNYIAELQEKLNASQNEVANYQQNQYLLSAIGRYNVVSVPPYTTFPTYYTGYGMGTYGVSSVV